MSKNIIIITGGAGFIGTNLIKLFLKKTKYKIISIDDYSSGKITNHLKNSRVKYIKGKTKNISSIIKDPKKIKTIFHFGEFARIYQSFIYTKTCMDSNSIGSNAVFNFCLRNKIKLVYSATSASLGNQGNDKDLSPYAFSKSINLEFLENLKRWFNFKYEVVYFYNVYGQHQISKGPMSTIIGIFEDHYKKGIALPIVKPGTQSRRFTHIDDTVNLCYYAWKKNSCKHYSITNKQSYSVIEVAKMFKTKVKFISKRPGERYSSTVSNKNLSNKIYQFYGKKKLSEYINNFLKNN